MESVLQSYGRLFRAVIFLLCLAGLVYLIAVKLFEKVNAVSDVSVEVNEKGGLIFKASKKSNDNTVTERYTQFLLPSNKVWINTGIEIAEDEECEFKITGNVHLAINHLVKKVDADRIPVIKWTGPEGSAWENIGDMSDCADAKTKLLILPGSGKQIGNVVGFFYKDGDMNDRGFIDYFLTNRKQLTKDVFNIGERAVKANNTHAKARLFLSVNDILLDFTDSSQRKLSQIAFEGRKGENNAANWQLLLKEQEYYRLWFDDNVGGFLVNLIIRKKMK
jgi:hypothetical protein